MKRHALQFTVGAALFAFLQFTYAPQGALAQYGGWRDGYEPRDPFHGRLSPRLYDDIAADRRLEPRGWRGRFEPGDWPADGRFQARRYPPPPPDADRFYGPPVRERRFSPREEWIETRRREPYPDRPFRRDPRFDERRYSAFRGPARAEDFELDRAPRRVPGDFRRPGPRPSYRGDAGWLAGAELGARGMGPGGFRAPGSIDVGRPAIGGPTFGGSTFGRGGFEFRGTGFGGRNLGTGPGPGLFGFGTDVITGGPDDTGR